MGPCYVSPQVCLTALAMIDYSAAQEIVPQEASMLGRIKLCAVRSSRLHGRRGEPKHRRFGQGRRQLSEQVHHQFSDPRNGAAPRFLSQRKP